ncbi:hypothetical protein P7K49_033027, partial [Saguinus oedipus]
KAKETHKWARLLQGWHIDGILHGPEKESIVAHSPANEGTVHSLAKGVTGRIRPSTVRERVRCEAVGTGCVEREEDVIR